MMNISPRKHSAVGTSFGPEVSSSSAILANNNGKNEEGGSNINTSPPTTTTATIVTTIEQIQSECSHMISALRELEQEEHDLQCQLDILSREALLCGFQADKVEKVLLRKPSTKRKAGCCYYYYCIRYAGQEDKERRLT
jgi:hypothetical protein